MLNLYTTVWGKMIDTYLRVTLPSLLQPNNVPSAIDLLGTYTFYAGEDARSLIQESPAYASLASLIDVRWEAMQKREGQGWYPAQELGWDITANILHQMRHSLAMENYMLVVSPDWLIGNGSILNMAALCAAQRYNPILFGFPKVDPAEFEAFAHQVATSVVTNRDLVSLSVRHFAPSPSLLRKLAPGVWLAAHQAPTPCVLPDQEMVDFFATNPTANQGYDHVLPCWMIKKGYPWHMIPESDTFFVSELGYPWQGYSAPWLMDVHGQEGSFFSTLRQIWEGAYDV